MREHQSAGLVFNGQGSNHCGVRPDAAKNGGKSHVGCIASGAEAHEAHGDAGAGWIEDIPAVTKVDLDVSLEVGRAERRVGAVVGAGCEARRNVDGAA